MSESTFIQLLKSIKGTRSIASCADEWGLPKQRLYDLLAGHTTAPSVETLRAIAKGSGHPYSVLLLAAYPEVPAAIS